MNDSFLQYFEASFKTACKEDERDVKPPASKLPRPINPAPMVHIGQFRKHVARNSQTILMSSRQVKRDYSNHKDKQQETLIHGIQPQRFASKLDVQPKAFPKTLRPAVQQQRDQKTIQTGGQGAAIHVLDRGDPIPTATTFAVEQQIPACESLPTIFPTRSVALQDLADTASLCKECQGVSTIAIKCLKCNGHKTYLETIGLPPYSHYIELLCYRCDGKGSISANCSICSQLAKAPETNNLAQIFGRWNISQ